MWKEEVETRKKRKISNDLRALVKKKKHESYGLFVKVALVYVTGWIKLADLHQIYSNTVEAT